MPRRAPDSNGRSWGEAWARFVRALGRRGGAPPGLPPSPNQLIKYFFAPMLLGPTPCVSCAGVCTTVSGASVVKMDAAEAGAATAALVRAADAYVRRRTGNSLLKEVHRFVTATADPLLAAQKVPVLRHTGLARVLGAGALLRFDAARPVRVRVMEYVLRTYVDYYVPALRYNVRALNAELFGRLRPQVVAFMRGRDGDLAPLAAFLVTHLVQANPGPNPACALCTRLPFRCTKTTRRLPRPAAAGRRVRAARAVPVGSYTVRVGPRSLR